MNMQVLVAHPGTQHASRLARELAARGLLGEFWTGLALVEDGIAARMASRLRFLPPFRGLSNRILRGVPASRVHRLPANEVRALLALRRGTDKLPVLHDRNQRFQALIPDASIQRCDTMIGFDTSSWLLARRAHMAGKPFYLDRTIGHPATLLRIEEEIHRRYPEWCDAPQARPAYLEEAEATEHHLAHRIVVGSSFAKSTLVAAGVAANKVVVNPYGVDWARFRTEGAAAPERPRRFLFLGSHLARKGLPVLLDAWRKLGRDRRDAELWLAGPCAPARRRLIPELPGLRVLGPIAHRDVPALLAQADVLVLPSWLEGFSLVVLEALAAGLPFIATPNTGVQDLPDPEAVGRIVPVGSIEGLVAAISHYIANPPDRAAVQGACASWRERFTWSAYGDRWVQLLGEPI